MGHLAWPTWAKRPWGAPGVRRPGGARSGAPFLGWAHDAGSPPPTTPPPACTHVGYLADAATATTAYLAGALEKPLLVEGPAGVGKTELAKAVARATRRRAGAAAVLRGPRRGARALRVELQEAAAAHPGLAGRATAPWDETHDDIFTDEFLLTRPLLTAIRREEPTVLLIDEVDKTDVEVEGLLLEVLSDFQVTIPELGTVSAVRRPFVVLTSNASRELSEAVKRRCLYLHLDYPDAEREREIVTSQVPELDEQIATQLVETVVRLRELELKKAPSIAESVDWARTLVALEIRELDAKAVDDTLGRRAQARLRPGPRGPRAAAARVSARDGAARGSSGLVERHLAFLEALRGAGLPVSLAEDLDADRRAGRARVGPAPTVRDAYAATLVKRPVAARRPSTRSSTSTSRGWSATASRGVRPAGRATEEPRAAPGVRDNAEALAGVPRASCSRRWRPATRSGCSRWPPRRSAGSGRCPGGAPGSARGRPTPRCSGSRPRQLVDQLGRPPSPARAAPRRRRDAPADRAGRRGHRDGRGRRAAPDRGGEGPRPRRERGAAPQHRPARLHLRPPAPTWSRCAARSTRWRAGSRPG